METFLYSPDSQCHPISLDAGLMYLLGIEFKLTTSILFTVAFGIAVDDSIHFMAKLKTELDRGKNLLYAIKRTFFGGWTCHFPYHSYSGRGFCITEFQPIRSDTLYGITD
ncbi:hypothetical protein [Algoriphagus boritolerans]|uniref:hypothetical protein n=1 Tax=Algoriphagus boritolerans TaxID=308111 RepID=UPI002FCE1F4C